MWIITQGASRGDHTDRLNSSKLVAIDDVSYLIDVGTSANSLKIRAKKSSTNCKLF